MAESRATRVTKILRLRKNGVLSTQTRTYVSKYLWIPDKLNGSVITLPGGSLFRKATPRMRWTRELTPLAGGTTTFYRFGEKWEFEFQSGGWKSDFAIEPNMPNIKSSIGSIPKFSTAPTAIPAEMRNEASTKALLDIADAKAAVGENLATFRQTVQMLHRPSWGLVNHIRKAYADRTVRPFFSSPLDTLRRYGKIPKDVASIYLAYVYGAIPFMQDIYGILELMKKRGSKTHLLYGHGTSSRQCEIVVPSYTGGGVTVSIPSGNERALVRSRIWARIDPNCVGLRTLNQAGLVNPISLAWELVPFSFVIDWFTPIGSVLQALTAPAGLIFVDGTESNRFSLSATVFEEAYDSVAVGNASNPAQAGLQVEGYLRKTLTNWPLPGVWASSNPFGGDRATKALALAILNLHRLRNF